MHVSCCRRSKELRKSEAVIRATYLKIDEIQLP